jgi:UDP-N-acetylmuramoyl-tripeptide--D-alanyl-D-alanine ligase
MKSILKPILKYYLKVIAKLVLTIHRPKIIAVAGSTNKTFVRDEIRRLLSEAGKNVRANQRNFNTEIGLPLAILNISSGYGSYSDWWPAMGKAFLAIFQKNFPKYLVLELGVSRSGDMRYLLSIVNPEIVVVTDITQRYLESFSGMNHLVGEYIYLIRKTKKGGAVILNQDNLRVKALARRAKYQVSYFGKSCQTQADWQIATISRLETGQLVTIKHNNEMQEFRQARFGQHHAYALAAALVVAEKVK